MQETAGKTRTRGEILRDALRPVLGKMRSELKYEHKVQQEAQQEADRHKGNAERLSLAMEAIQMMLRDEGVTPEEEDPVGF